MQFFAFVSIFNLLTFVVASFTKNNVAPHAIQNTELTFLFMSGSSPLARSSWTGSPKDSISSSSPRSKDDISGHRKHVAVATAARGASGASVCNNFVILFLYYYMILYKIACDTVNKSVHQKNSYNLLYCFVQEKEMLCCFSVLLSATKQ